MVGDGRAELSEAMDFEHDHPEPRECALGGGKDVAVLRTLDIHLEQQIALRVAVSEPLFEADTVLAGTHVQPLLDECLHPRLQRRLELLDVAGEVAHVGLDAVAVGEVVLEVLDSVHTRREAGGDAIQVVRHQVRPVDVTADADKRCLGRLRLEELEHFDDLCRWGRSRPGGLADVDSVEALHSRQGASST